MEAAIEPLTPEVRGRAVRLLARAFVTNPLHEAVFGEGRLDANEAFFDIGLERMKGRKLVAVDGDQLLGVIHWVDSSACQVSMVERLLAVPDMIRGFGVRSALRVGGWLSTWAAHDPAEPHIHLGPIGVPPESQGRGIGRRLMERYCEALDRTESAGYLETDREPNVAFYERFGFYVSGTTTIHGVVNYFMTRDRRAPAG